MIGRIPLLAAIAVVVAGCVTIPEPADPSSVGGAVAGIGEPIVQTHNHSDPAQHQASYGLTLIGHTYGHPAGKLPAGMEYLELAWHDGWVYMCRYGTEGGFVVIDARDPAAPTPVAEMPGLGCHEIKTDKTGNLVFWGQQRADRNETILAAGGSQEHSPRGVMVTDVTDRANPRHAGYFPIPPNGVHTLRYYCYEDEGADPAAPCAGREVLFVQTYDLLRKPILYWEETRPLGSLLTPHYSDAILTQRVSVLEVTRQADGVQLRPLAEIQEAAIPPAGSGYGYRPHDSWPERHAVTGDHLLYVSYWDYGVVVYDINDPGRPQRIARYSDFAPSEYAKIHFSRTHPGLLDGKVVLVAEPELEVAKDTGQYTVIDATDPLNMVKLGWWELPGLVFVDKEFRFSPHNFNLANGRMYLAHNHAGVWVVNLTDPANPESAGFYQPHMPREGWTRNIPQVWSAFYHDGLVYASDHASGLYILRYPHDPVPSGAYLAASWTPPAGFVA